MGASGSKQKAQARKAPKDASSAEPESQKDASSAEPESPAKARAGVLVTSLGAAGVEPVKRTTRDATKRDVLDQRSLATKAVDDALTRTRRQPTRTAIRSLDQQPKRHRMSRLGTAARGALVKNIETAAKAPQASQHSFMRAPPGTAASLLERLHSLGMDSVEMEPDGNCQFRAIADQLFGSQEHHALARAVACAHMKAASGFFGIYFESPSEFASYLRGMRKSRTWGDELTLRACVEAFGCVAHVVTSDTDNWYLVYTPESPPDELTKLCRKHGLTPPRPKKEIFINYISPIHYNAISLASSPPAQRVAHAAQTV